MYAKSEPIIACFGHGLKKRMNILLCDYIPIRVSNCLQSIKSMIKKKSVIF